MKLRPFSASLRALAHLSPELGSSSLRLPCVCFWPARSSSGTQFTCTCTCMSNMKLNATCMYAGHSQDFMRGGGLRIIYCVRNLILEVTPTNYSLSCPIVYSVLSYNIMIMQVHTVYSYIKDLSRISAFVASFIEYVINKAH